MNWPIAGYFGVIFRRWRISGVSRRDAGVGWLIAVDINHTSDQNPWFQKARTRRFARQEIYVWSDSPERYADAQLFSRISGPQTGRGIRWPTYYWHRFYAQPDRSTTRSCTRPSRPCSISGNMGVDGLRLDAVPIFTSAKERTAKISRNAYLKKLRAHMDAKFPIACSCGRTSGGGRGQVFRRSDESHMNFHFRSCRGCSWRCKWRISFRLSTSSNRRRQFDSCQWAMFLRNHDELTPKW